MKRRKKSLKTRVKSQLWTLVREYVCLRDKSVCQRCLRPVEGHNRHPSHVYGKKAYPRLEFEPDNVKILCFHCHINWWHKNPIEASEWFKQKFPDRDLILRELKMNQSPLTITELELWLYQMENMINEEKENQCIR
jgi:5-methylcytosine-specific restriction endonuclease McrA